MTFQKNLLTPADSSMPTYARQLRGGVAILLSAVLANAIATPEAIAIPIEVETTETEADIQPFYPVLLSQTESEPLVEEDFVQTVEPIESAIAAPEIEQSESSAAALTLSDPEQALDTADFYVVDAAPIEENLANSADNSPIFLTQSEAESDRPDFGAKGQTRWFVQGAAATEGDGESFGLLGGGASYFFAKGHSINLALNALAFDLPDKDPVGLNLDLLVRSHWIRGENWSIYIDGGAGIIVSSSRVPNEGSSFNFTPQGGLGASINVNKEKDQRLLIGARWHHISNANTFESNPGLDTYMGYVGMTFPLR